MAAYKFLTLLFLIVYAFYLPQDVMDIDSTQYAEIAREMVENGEYIFLKDNGRKYLDKPIMTFWILALSYHIFGISNFSYRFPAYLALLFSLYGLYRIAKILFGEEKKAWLSVVFYVSSPAVFSMLTSPIIDIYLTTFLIYTFLFYFLGIYRHPGYFYGMYVFTGLGFLTKGPISFVLPVIAIGGDMLLRRNFKLLQKMKIISGIFIVSVMVGFWVVVLYQDFGIYGPYFFLFLQSFGRFLSKFYDTGWDPFYFYFTFLFAILPFGFFFLYTILKKLKELYEKYKTTPLRSWWEEVFSRDRTLWLWVFLTLFFLSFSKFRLPQYLFWLVPGASLIAAYWYEENDEKNAFLFYSTSLLFLVFLVALPFFTGEFYKVTFFAVLVFLVMAFLGFRLFRIDRDRVILYSLSSTALFYLYVVTSLYPMLIQYQPAGRIAGRIPPKKEKEEVLYTMGIPMSHRSYAFYTQRYIRPLEVKKEKFLETLSRKKEDYVVVHEQALPVFLQEFGNLQVEILGKYPSYKVSRPGWEFFDKEKRNSLVHYVYLCKVTAGEERK